MCINCATVPSRAWSTSMKKEKAMAQKPITIKYMVVVLKREYLLKILFKHNQPLHALYHWKR